MFNIYKSSFILTHKRVAPDRRIFRTIFLVLVSYSDVASKCEKEILLKKKKKFKVMFMNTWNLSIQLYLKHPLHFKSPSHACFDINYIFDFIFAHVYIFIHN